MRMTYTVRARGLSKTFDEHRALSDVDLDVEAGTVLALLGPNGAGKTTLVRVLATLERPDAGSATVAGHDLLADPVGVRRSISLTGQAVAVDGVLTARENLEMVAQLLRLTRRDARARAAELLDAFGLTAAADRRTATYSGGMRRRLDLAISMVVRPALLFLDEPTTGLDLASREQLWATVQRLVADGVTVLLTTQYLEEADQLADRLVLLRDGRVVASGTPAALKASLGGELVRLEFADEPSYRRAVACLGRPGSTLRRRTVELSTAGAADEVLQVLRRLEAVGAPAARVSTQRPGLDDVFRSLTTDAHVTTGASA